MDACSDPEIQEVVVMAGAQLGKTEAILNIIGYHIDNAPCPILVLQPTLEMAQAFSKDRIASGLLRSTPVLRDKVKDPRARDSGNTTLHKVFAGGALTIVGANSPAGLASRPIRIVLCDETDRYPTSAGAEGDPIQLARKRSATFWNRKVIMVSTPTNKGASRIEDAYEKSDRRQYHVPCKHCHEHQVLKWSHVRWEDNRPETAKYLCEHCGVLWDEADRVWSIRNGQWVAREEFRGIAGFHINGLYSPWTPLADGVRDFLSVRKNPEQLRVFTNTYLGETWEDEGERLSDFDLADRRETMDFVPDEVMVLTAGIDCQDNRLEMTLVGWGRNDESWVLSHQTFFGDPSTPQLWADLDVALNREYKTETGRLLRIRASCVDSGGHFTNSVYAYCKKNQGKGIFAIKGVGGDGKAIAGRPSKNNTMKCPLFPIGVDTVKDLLMARLRIEDEGSGYVHFSDTLDDEWFKQLTAEKAVTRFHKGFKKRIWHKTRNRNEALDCMVYAIAAYSILGVDVNTIAAKLASVPREPEKPVKQETRRSFVPKVRKNFVNAW